VSNSRNVLLKEYICEIIGYRGENEVAPGLRKAKIRQDEYGIGMY
jgi:hypothetical protein